MTSSAEKRDLDAAGLARGFHRLEQTQRSTKRAKPYHYSTHIFDVHHDPKESGYAFEGNVRRLEGCALAGRLKPVLDVYHAGGMLGALLVEWRSTGRGLGGHVPPPKQHEVNRRLDALLEGVEAALVSTKPIEAVVATVQGLLGSERGAHHPHIQIDLRPLLQLLLDLAANETLAIDLAQLAAPTTMKNGGMAHLHRCFRAAGAFFEGVRLGDAAQSTLGAECRAGPASRCLFVPYLRREFQGSKSNVQSYQSFCAVFLAGGLRFASFPARLVGSDDPSGRARLCARSGEVARRLWLATLSPPERAKHEPERAEDTRLAIKLYNTFRFLATRARSEHHVAPYGDADDDQGWFHALSCAPQTNNEAMREAHFRHGGGVLGSLLEAWCRMHVCARKLRDGLSVPEAQRRRLPPGEQEQWLQLEGLTHERTMWHLCVALKDAATALGDAHATPDAKATALLARCDHCARFSSVTPDVWPMVHLLLVLQSDATIGCHLVGCLGTDVGALRNRARAMAIATACYFAEDKDERAKFSTSLGKDHKGCVRETHPATASLVGLVGAAGGTGVVGELLAVCLEFLCAPAVAALRRPPQNYCDCTAALLGLAHNHAHHPFAGGEPPTTKAPLKAALFRLPGDEATLYVKVSHFTQAGIKTGHRAEPWPTSLCHEDRVLPESERVALAQKHARYDLGTALQIAVKGGPLTSPFGPKAVEPRLLNEKGGRSTAKCHTATLATVRAIEAQAAAANAELEATCAERASLAALLQRWLTFSRGPMEDCCVALQLGMGTDPRRKKTNLDGKIAKYVRALLVARAYPTDAAGVASTADALARRVLYVASGTIVHYAKERHMSLAHRAERGANNFLSEVSKQFGVGLRPPAIAPEAERCLRPPPPEEAPSDPAEEVFDEVSTAQRRRAADLANAPPEALELMEELRREALDEE